MGLGRGFAGGLSQGLESGMRLYMAKQQADREQADWQQKQDADKGSQAILNRDQTQQFNPNQIANAAQSSGDVGTWADQNDPSKGLVYANAPTDAGPSQGTSVAPQYGLGGTVQTTPFTPSRSTRGTSKTLQTICAAWVPMGSSRQRRCSRGRYSRTS